MHHTSGLPDYIDLQFAELGSAKAWFTVEDSLETLRAAQLDFQPGARYEYSNSNYLLLGQIVQRASGKSLRELARERIFEPLGMEDTSFHDRHDQVVVGRSHGYSRMDEEGRGAWRVDITTLDHVGDGGVFTTIGDMAKWIANFADNRLGHGQAFLDLMHERGELATGEELDYAFGLMHGEHAGAANGVARRRVGRLPGRGGALSRRRPGRLRAPRTRRAATRPRSRAPSPTCSWNPSNGPASQRAPARSAGRLARIPRITYVAERL